MDNIVNNSIYLRRRSKIALPAPSGGDAPPVNYLASVVKNVEALANPDALAHYKDIAELATK